MDLKIYAGLTTTERPYNANLVDARIGAYTTTFGGLYGTFEFFLAANPTANYQWAGGDRVAIRDGLVIVWEGIIATINRAVRDGETGITVSCVGAQSRLGQLTIDRRWADARLDGAAWVPSTTASAAEKIRDDRQGRIRFTPNGDEFNNGEYALASYTMPTGRTIARVTATSALSETATWSPEACKNNALTDLPNAIDGDATTTATVSLNSGEYFYIGTRRPFGRVTFDFGGTVNANTATIAAAYVDGNHNWQALTVTDGTSSGGKTWAQDGTISWTIPADWNSNGLVGSSRMYWVRLTPSSNLTGSVVINEITIGAAQSWLIQCYYGATNVFSRSADGSGAHDVTITPQQTINLRLLSQAKQTGIANGTIYGEVTDLVVYDDTTAPTVTKVATDILTEAADVLNSDTAKIGSNTYGLTPFVTDGPETIADILDRAVSFGDSSQNAWYWTLLNSEEAATPDGQPVLKLAQVPALTDYDYVVGLDQTNLLPPFELLVDYDAIVNYVTVIYTDPETGRDVVITPDDYATLKDTTSITAYGERHGEPLRLGETTAAAALNYGRRFLAQRKDPQYSVSGPLRIIGGIRTKAGGWIPAAQIHADGTRVKIENFIDDVAAADGSGLTFRIAATSYNPTTDICEISTGNYDDLAVLLGRLQ